MIGNVIDSQFLRVVRLPDRGRAVGVADGRRSWSWSLFYVRRAGTEELV